MNIGFVGLGKLGLPCALAMGTKLNTTILGYDLNQDVKKYIEDKNVPYLEKDIDYYLNSGKVSFQENLESVILNSDTVFIAVQTPHEEKFEGITPVQNEVQDFDYSYIIKCNQEIKNILDKHTNKKINIVVISTMLPGTMRDNILPIYADIRDRVDVFYNPYFIAMGTTIEDFLHPEFILIGKEEKTRLPREIINMYNQIANVPVHVVLMESAELAKVSYNTFIGMKIIFANAIGEITRKVGGDSDQVIDVLSSANKRIISSAYMRPGMGDGGGCHPRDQIAMSYLAKKYDLSVNIFDFVAKARDEQTLELAKIIKRHSDNTNMSVVILGEAYKKNINLTVGSPSKLLQYYLKELNVDFTVVDPLVYKNQIVNFDGPKIFFLATPHDIFKNLVLPIHSILIDVWGNFSNLNITRQYGVLIRYPGKVPLE
jgi:UDPglucose 6-dehydrogenase